MKIGFTGGGTGGHVFPLIAVAEHVQSIADQEKLAIKKLYFFSDKPYDKQTLLKHELHYIPIPAGKIRRYFSVQNFFDLFKTGVGVVKALLVLFRVYPDVIFAKGGYASFPTLLAARLLRIPVIIHESDAAPGMVTKWAGKFAQKIALSYDEAAQYFPPGKTARVGQPIRKEVANVVTTGAHNQLGLDPNLQTIFIIGGSQGSKVINGAIITALPDLLDKYQIIHQVGRNNLEDVKNTVSLALADNPHIHRYKLYDFLNPLTLSMAAGVSSLVITRAGSMLFEIAAWSLPSVIIPIEKSNRDHQKKNAYSFSRAGAGIVIEEKNLRPHILVAEVDRILGNPDLQEAMSKSAHGLYDPDAAKKIAEEIIRIALSHEK